MVNSDAILNDVLEVGTD